MSTDAHCGVKIGHKLQSLSKISNISAADPPPSSFRSIPTLCIRLCYLKIFMSRVLTATLRAKAKGV